jgi:hypothetical protein
MQRCRSRSGGAVAGTLGRMGMITDEGWTKVFFWLFAITMLIHLAVIVAIAGLIK